jgi:hypothetical protein
MLTDMVARYGEQYTARDCVYAASKEAVSKDAASKEAVSEEAASMEIASKKAASKDAASKEAASKEAAFVVPLHGNLDPSIQIGCWDPNCDLTGTYDFQI